MTRQFPEETAGEFPEPPREFVDGEGRAIRIDKVTADDREPLVSMYERFHPEDRAQGIPPVGEAAIRNWLDNILGEDTRAVVARHGDAVVGNAVVVPDDERAYELAIFVLREYQGAGIGTVMLESLLGLARRSGVERVWLTVERWNDPAVSLYRRVGFQEIDTEGLEMEMSIRL
jgi:GNAT superfamily N-acetyltransferase